MMTSAINHSHEALLGLIIFSIGVPLFFSGSIRRHTRHARDASQLWTDRLRGAGTAIIGVAFCVLFLAPLAWALFPGEAWIGLSLTGLFLGTVVVHMALEVTRKMAVPHDKHELIGTPFRVFLDDIARARFVEHRHAVVLLKLELLPNGFRDVHLAMLLRSPFKSEYRALGALYLLLLVLAVMSIFTLLGTGQNLSIQVVRTWSVFWVLMFAVSMTAPFAVAWLVLKYLATTGTIECQITLRSSISKVATWVSIGGVVGLLTGTLSFVPLRLMAESGISQDPVSLSLLADLSLAGAVAGFIGAHFAVIFNCTATVKNRLVALTLPVLTVSGSTAAASLIGINPAANAQHALSLIRKFTVLPDRLESAEALGPLDWKVLLSATESGTSGVFPDSTSFFLIIAGSTAVLALSMLARYVASSLRAAAAQSRGAAGQIRHSVNAVG